MKRCGAHLKKRNDESQDPVLERISRRWNVVAAMAKVVAALLGLEAIKQLAESRPQRIDGSFGR
jgi:hypothetical protein